MGLFNVVKIKEKCSACGNFAELRVQFKYGELWQYEYKPGDSLIWGKRRFGNDGEPGHKRVVVDAVAEHCPVCHAEGPDYEVWLEKDRIVAVKPASGQFDFVRANETYVVLEK